MKKIFSSIAILAVVCSGITACSKDNKSIAQPIQPVADTPFTSKSADQAYATFNDYFYSKKDQLFYSTTEKKDIGAIWTQAIMWDIVMDNYNRTKDTASLTKIKEIYNGGYNRYDKYNWENRTEWFIYDDMMWWVISLTRASQITNNKVYLDTAIAGFNRVWRDSYDSQNGGMWWDFGHTGKNSCINFPTVIAAVQLYNVTRDQAYLDKAKMIYDWSVSNLVDVNAGRVADNNINGNKGWSNYTYNQGTYIGASIMLNKVANSKNYLDNAVKAATYTEHVMSDANGMLPAEGDWNEQGVMKAIFARYMMMLVNDGNQQQFLPWIRKNINTAWGNRDQDRHGLTFRNYGIACPKGTIQSYEASSIVGFMQVCAPVN